MFLLEDHIDLSFGSDAPHATGHFYAWHALNAIDCSSMIITKHEEVGGNFMPYFTQKGYCAYGLQVKLCIIYLYISF